MNGLRSGVCAGALLLALGIDAAVAQDLPGKFEGVTIDAKLIGDDVGNAFCDGCHLRRPPRNG